jgi:hypothetical protein
MMTHKPTTEVSVTGDDDRMPHSMIQRQMEQFLDMQMQVSQATSQLITSIHQAMTGPTSAPRSHGNSIGIDDQETLEAPLSLISHLEKLAEVQNQILPQFSRLMNPGQRMLGTHKEPVSRQVAKEQRYVQLNHQRANQKDCYCRKHFGFPPFQGDSNNKAERSKYLDLSSNQNIKVPPHRKDSLIHRQLTNCSTSTQGLNKSIQNMHKWERKHSTTILKDGLLPAWSFSCVSVRDLGNK